MPMNSRHTVSLSELSKGHWLGEPSEPPPPPVELNLVVRVRSWLSELAPLTRAWWSRLGDLVSLTRAWSWLSELTPLTFARYLIAFFIGVGATIAWQSYSGTKEETVAATPGALDSVRQSVDKLAAEIAKVRAMEQEILVRISAPSPRPVATPTRNPAQQPLSGR
jgi:hypothetical protein